MELPCPVCGVENSSKFPDVPCGLCCEECKSRDSQMRLHCNDDYRMRQLFKDMWKHIDVYHHRKNPKSHIGNGAPQGAFAFTLTKSPADDLTEDDMIMAVRKLMAQKSCPVEKYAWYLEYGNEEDKTHPHIHGMYETFTKGRIECKHFKRAWNIWGENSKDPRERRQGLGFRGGYHRPVRSDEGYAQYIAKSNGQHDTNIIN